MRGLAFSEAGRPTGQNRPRSILDRPVTDCETTIEWHPSNLPFRGENAQKKFRTAAKMPRKVHRNQVKIGSIMNGSPSLAFIYVC
jgi:hypothetical protein